MPTIVLFLLTFILAISSLVVCTFLARYRSVGALFGVAFALAFFLWIAWWQPFREHAGIVHIVLFAAGLTAAAMLRRGDRAIQAFGLAAGATMAALVLFSAAIFPALTRPEGLAQAYRAEIETAAEDKPYCTLAERERTGENPSFYAVARKWDVQPDWSGPRRFLYSWIDEPEQDLSLYVRTGEPQLRLGYEYEFTGPGGLYDIVVFEWDEGAGTFQRLGAEVTVGSEIYQSNWFVEGTFACIPQADFLAADLPAGVVGISTPYGDFVVPTKHRPATYLEGWYFSSRTKEGFYFSVPTSDLFREAPEAPALVFRLFRSSMSWPGLSTDVNMPDGRDASSRDDLVKLGFTENAFGLLANPTLSEEMFAFDASGNIVTAILCKDYETGRICDHRFMGPDLLAGATETLMTDYPADFLADWRAIEKTAQGLLVAFAVPGPVPPEKLTKRPNPTCIAVVREEQYCLAYDALP
jgi:hypothetical protein